MDALMSAGAAKAVSAAGNVREEPTAVATAVFFARGTIMGWHPVLPVPARAVRP